MENIPTRDNLLAVDTAILESSFHLLAGSAVFVGKDFGPDPHLTVATSPRAFLLLHHKLRTVTANVLGCRLAEVQACGLSCTVYGAMSGLIMLGFKKSVIILKCHC